MVSPYITLQLQIIVMLFVNKTNTATPVEVEIITIMKQTHEQLLYSTLYYTTNNHVLVV